MKSCYFLTLIVFTTILINVSGYAFRSSAIDDDEISDQESSSPAIDSTPVEANDPEQLTSPTTVTTSVDSPVESGPHEFDGKNLINTKLIARSNKFDHKEDKNYQSFILSNVETYQLPSNDILVRAKIVANIDWIIRRGVNHPRMIYHHLQPIPRSPDHENQIGRFNNRRKRQADPMTNQFPPNDGMMEHGGPGMRPHEPGMGGNPVVEGFRAFVGRMRQLITEVRKAFNGNQVQTNMQGLPTGMSTDPQ